MIVSGTFAGTGAALHVGIGFKPDFVKIYNLGSSSIPMIDWSKKMEGATAKKEGLLLRKIVDSGSTGNANVANLADGAGIEQYDGGDIMATAATAYIVKKAGGTYDYEGAAAKDIIPAGFTINETALVNVSTNLCFFEAGLYDA